VVLSSQSSGVFSQERNPKSFSHFNVKETLYESVTTARPQKLKLDVKFSFARYNIVAAPLFMANLVVQIALDFAILSHKRTANCTLLLLNFHSQLQVHFTKCTIGGVRTAVAEWLRCCATNR